MAYVAARGGEQAIQEAERLFHQLNGEIDAEFVARIARHMPYLVDRVMGEGSLYAPELAALALAQTGGDLYEAVLLLRGYRSTQPRIGYAEPIEAGYTFTVRRISAAFKDIPGGQVLGPTLDYSHRLLRLDLLDRNPACGMQHAEPNAQFATDESDHAPELPGAGAADSSFIAHPASFPNVADWQRANGLIAPLPQSEPADPATLPDVTREPVSFPAPRPHRLQMLARADTGGVLALGYASMRGYGMAHPTVNELRLSYADVRLRHPVTGAIFNAGRVRISQCEVASKSAAGPAPITLGFTATFGWNEVKTIAGSMLDLEMSSATPRHPAHSEDFVLYHTEAVESSGFCIHYKLPHYVTFTSALDALRRAINSDPQSQPAEEVPV
ncbi:MAG: carbon-phosphorus lyase complex subunit PhnI [Oscillochloris sp.]|nr:carbon-phosphorus lyase complex subunit PhnI [Oscillochloris sp.]